MPEAQIASSHYEPDGPGDGRKLCVNFYAEKNGQDPARPFKVVTTPGSRLVDNGVTLTSGVRGLFQADGFAGGKLIVPDGTSIRLLDTGAETFTALTGSVAGSDRMQAGFGEVQGGFLANGALYASDGTSVAAVSDADWATLLSDHGQTAFTSIDVMGQRLLATYGNRFGFSDTLQFNTTSTLNYYTAESSPDALVCGVALGVQYLLMGTQTIEPWVQTGDGDNPFSPITGQVIRRGVLARDTVVKLDNTVFFIADDHTVRRLDGLTPVILNVDDPWVSRHLEQVDADSIVCKAIERDGHSFYVIRTPERCIVYDVATRQFHTRQSLKLKTWEWLFHVRVGAKHFAANADTQLVELSRDYLSDKMSDADTFGTEIPRTFTAHLPVKMGRDKMVSIRLEGAKGVGLTNGQGVDPLVRMAISRDKGITYGKARERSLGRKGDYDARAIWRMNGRAKPEQTVLKFTMSDPVQSHFTNVRINEI